MKEIREETSFRQITDRRFTFRCHGQIGCFTECCAALNLTLTPYDVLRLKNRLGVSSDEFLDRYTEMRMDEHGRFPMVRLKMNDDERKRCPFVTSAGCTLYGDRPGACRLYPVGRASLKVDGRRGAREKFFMVREAHCLGFDEEREWTLDEWMANEGVIEYNAMNDPWMEIITSGRSLGRERDIPRKIQVFYMASYNLDKFREFISGSRFFDLFVVEKELRDRLLSDDVELMKFAFRWMKFSLFGEKTLEIRPGVKGPGGRPVD